MACPPAPSLPPLCSGAVGAGSTTSGVGSGFVTGATIANFTALAAARHKVLADVGWDVEKDGLIGAPEVTVVVGDEDRAVHGSVSLAFGVFGARRHGQ